ncbi:MAG: ABC transporter substrate-binding protein, partial [Planctomycetota bacterium]
MNARQVALVLIALGAVVLLSTWGSVADWTENAIRGGQVDRDQEVVYWTSSGSPQNELKRARQFEQRHPNVNIDPNFRQTGGLQDILFVSFLSGNPPDYMSVKGNELRDFVEIGGVYPLDELVEAENKKLMAQRGQTYFDQFLMGKARVYRFTVDPDDRFLREMDKYPLEAARLLNMHGKIVGLRDMPSPDTLTYNKRIFQLAAREFPSAGLVDENDEPIPPKTWLDLYEKARVITEYGRIEAQRRGLSTPVTYGIVIQGQEKRDIMRGIRPLARRAGTDAFAFQGDTKTVITNIEKGTDASEGIIKEWSGKPIGYFEYHHPANLAAFALLKKLRTEGLVLPGTKARGYEQARTALAQGEAAMLIDGYHAALIGAERVPWAAQDLGSAPVPKPYHAPGEGLDEQAIEAEKQKLHNLLALDRLDIELSPGNKLPWTAKEEVQFFTSMVRHPQAAWDWIHFANSSEEILKSECRRGTVQFVEEARRHLGDPEWFPYPYQKQVYDLVENHSTLWP